MKTLLLTLGIVCLASRATATPVTWHWAGPVTGYLCAAGGPCHLDPVVPIGTPVNVFVTLDPSAPPANPSSPCNRGTASASLSVLGTTYTNTATVWEEGFGFGPGLCVPGYEVVEVVVPSWGLDGPALPGGWLPFHDAFFPGLWWDGHLIDGQPLSIRSQFPAFARDGSWSQQFTADLSAVPVPEPATWLLVSAGLMVARRRLR